MIIAEDLLLLAYDDDTGKAQADATDLDYRLAGALLVELALAGRVDVAGPDDADAWRRPVPAGRVVVRDPSPAGHPALDHALAVVAEKPRRAKDLVEPLSKGLRDALLSGLADRGVLRRQDGRILGIFPTTAWPAVDSGHEDQVRAACRAALLDGVEPDARTGALIAVAHGSGLVRGMVPREHRKAVDARAKALAEQSWAGGAVKKAVDEMLVAVMLPVMVATTMTVTTT